MKIGIQAQAILPMVEVEVMARTIARQTIQLHSIALTKQLTSAGKAEGGVAGGLELGDLHDARGDAGRRGRSHIGERDGDQRAIGDAADQIADEDPAPVDEDRASAGLAFEPRQRHQREAAGDEFEPEQHDG